jgi:hypothetical protein
MPPVWIGRTEDAQAHVRAARLAAAASDRQPDAANLASALRDGALAEFFTRPGCAEPKGESRLSACSVAYPFALGSGCPGAWLANG